MSWSDWGWKTGSCCCCCCAPGVDGSPLAMADAVVVPAVPSAAIAGGGGFESAVVGGPI